MPRNDRNPVGTGARRCRMPGCRRRQMLLYGKPVTVPYRGREVYVCLECMRAWKPVNWTPS